MKLPRWTHVGRVSVVASALAIALIGGLLVGIVDRSDNAGASAVTVSAQDIATEPGPTPMTSAAPVTSAAPMTSVIPIPSPTPTKTKKPKPATRERKAKNIPERPLGKHTGRRIVYDKALMTVWAMNEADEVVYRFPVVGRWDRPVKGKYEIFSQSKHSGNPNSKVTFDHMTRFAYGNDGKTAIGFHSIPLYYDGSMMHSTDQLGLPIATGGCVRMAAKDAKKLYKWAEVGDTVHVRASP
ncbi:MAG: L,D-transpeptidase [Candidatus Nanopelagicales bacterium]|nr:L,D-transpeptidase [Candidatus Nanopelagicales bacterium]